MLLFLAMPVEIELKFPDADLRALRERLQSLGARCQGWVFERNIVFDLPDRSLLANRVLLRLRSADGATLTLKRPLAKGERPARDCGKALQEVETTVRDARAMREILAGLGYAEVFCYEKVRASWKWEGATICLDRLPFGDFAELELHCEAADRVLERFSDLASRLGLDFARSTKKTYHELNKERRARLGLPEDENFVFEDQPPSGEDLCNVF
jgi:adenylate cyclase class 2